MKLFLVASTIPGVASHPPHPLPLFLHNPSLGNTLGHPSCRSIYLSSKVSKLPWNKRKNKASRVTTLPDYSFSSLRSAYFSFNLLQTKSPWRKWNIYRPIYLIKPVGMNLESNLKKIVTFTSNSAGNWFCLM